jgi:hypothetical protein
MLNINITIYNFVVSLYLFPVIYFKSRTNKPTLAQLVERRTVVVADILRSLVRIRQVGIYIFFNLLIIYAARDRPKTNPTQPINNEVLDPLSRNK